LNSLAQEINLDYKRLNEEVLYYIDKSDFTEEIIRANSHLTEFEKNLGEKIPIGKKLDFLIQEIFREINTLGVKAQSDQISQRVVEIKSELEKIREQVQNIE
jgi:uncharacterized protein (TIGR00255 family)